MDSIRSAQIIQFPGRAGRPAAMPAADEAGERLRQALAVLEAAVSRQSEAVGQWRGALGKLDSTAQALNASLRAYDARLGTLRDQVDAVGDQARGLDAWADAALAASAPTDVQAK